LKSRFPESHAEDNVGFDIVHAATGARLVYFPGCARVDPSVVAAAAGADCLFFDGTFWSSDELITLGLGTRRAEDMAHAPIATSSLDAFATAGVKQRYYIHINNTNPILREDSDERRAVEAAGWRVAQDGLELVLGGNGAARESAPGTPGSPPEASAP
jgi:pyrroloquinoline quinone biosynthesis protein B